MSSRKEREGEFLHQESSTQMMANYFSVDSAKKEDENHLKLKQLWQKRNSQDPSRQQQIQQSRIKMYQVQSLNLQKRTAKKGDEVVINLTQNQRSLHQNLSRDGSIERKEGDTDEIMFLESIVPKESRNVQEGLYDGVTENLIESKAYQSNQPKDNQGPKLKLMGPESPWKMQGLSQVESIGSEKSQNMLKLYFKPSDEEEVKSIEKMAVKFAHNHNYLRSPAHAHHRSISNGAAQKLLMPKPQNSLFGFQKGKQIHEQRQKPLVQLMKVKNSEVPINSSTVKHSSPSKQPELKHHQPNKVIVDEISSSYSSLESADLRAGNDSSSSPLQSFEVGGHDPHIAGFGSIRQIQGGGKQKIVPALPLGLMIKNNERRQMNFTMNKLQINQILVKQPNLAFDIARKEPLTQRDEIREGELSQQSHSPDLKRTVAFKKHTGRSVKYHSRESEEVTSNASNCTEERNFTPGQQQFKQFLKKKEDPKKRPALKLQKSRSNTKQIESKEERRTDIAVENTSKREVQHLRTNSYIGSNKMSPTAQPIPIEIFSSSDSQMKKFNPEIMQTLPNLDPIDLLSGKEDSANLSYYNMSPEHDLNEKTQPLSGILNQFNQRARTFQTDLQKQDNQKQELFNQKAAINNQQLKMGGEQSVIQPQIHIQNQGAVIRVRKSDEKSSREDIDNTDQDSSLKQTATKINTTNFTDSQVSRHLGEKREKQLRNIQRLARAKQQPQSQVADEHGPTSKPSNIRLSYTGPPTFINASKLLATEPDSSRSSNNRLKPVNDINLTQKQHQGVIPNGKEDDLVEWDSENDDKPFSKISSQQVGHQLFQIKRRQNQHTKSKKTNEINSISQIQTTKYFHSGVKSPDVSLKQGLKLSGVIQAKVGNKKVIKVHNNTADQKLKIIAPSSIGAQISRPIAQKKREMRIQSLYATTNSKEFTQANNVMSRSSSSRKDNANVSSSKALLIGGKKMVLSKGQQSKLSQLLQSNSKKRLKLSMERNPQKSPNSSLTTQLFDRLHGMISSTGQTTNASTKIQNIKQSSSKLTMAAQLHKYKAEASEMPDHCMSPKQQKPVTFKAVVADPSTTKKLNIPSLNIASINKNPEFNVNTSFVHPKTTKNNQSRGAVGDFTNVMVTVTPPESQRSNRKTNGHIIQEIKNAAQMSNRNNKLPNSERGRKTNLSRSPQMFNFKNLPIDNGSSDLSSGKKRTQLKVKSKISFMPRISEQMNEGTLFIRNDTDITPVKHAFANQVQQHRKQFQPPDQLDYESLDSDTHLQMAENNPKNKLEYATKILETSQQQRSRQKNKENSFEEVVNDYSDAYIRNTDQADDRFQTIKLGSKSVTKQNSVLDIRPITDVDESPRNLEENPFQNSNEQNLEKQILINLPFNGCRCNQLQGLGDRQQKKGCANSMRWLELAYKDDNFIYLSSYKMYQGFLQSSNQDAQQQMQLEQDIQIDLERTFQHVEYFRRQEIQNSMKRVLIAFANYEASVGYVQGMNFIVASLIFHAGEVTAFWLLCSLMEKYDLKQVLSYGLVGVQLHEQNIERLCQAQLPELFSHFEKTFVSVSLFSTDWIISMFLSFVPIELSHQYIELLFEKGWQVFYEVALALLKYYEQKLLKMDDAGQIVGQIKQARLGCEHLFIPTLSIPSSRIHQSNLASRKSELSNIIPFALNDQPEDLKDSSIFEESQSEYGYGGRPMRSHSVITEDQSNFLTSRVYLKNSEMWQQIVRGVQQKLQN